MLNVIRDIPFRVKIRKKMLKSYLKKISRVRDKKSTNYLDLPFLNYTDNDQIGVEAYKDNAIVHRCVSLIATSASHVPWQVFKNNKKNKE
jgi:phage portal protein BeeE